MAKLMSSRRRQQSTMVDGSRSKFTMVVQIPTVPYYPKLAEVNLQVVQLHHSTNSQNFSEDSRISKAHSKALHFSSYYYSSFKIIENTPVSHSTFTCTTSYISSQAYANPIPRRIARRFETCKDNESMLTVKQMHTVNR